MANLYEISAQILDCIDVETGEVVDVERVAALEMALDEKVENIALWIKNLMADAEAYKREKESFAYKQKVAENKIKSLKEYLGGYLAGNKWKSDRVSISFRKSQSVEVDLQRLMAFDGADKFLRYKEPDADKTAIKEALKNGDVIPGCALVENQSIQIK